MRPLVVVALASCRIEIGPPGTGAGDAVSCTDAPAGEVWVYTSMYPEVLDALEPLVREHLPGVEPRWFQAGSEKVAQRIEAEWAAGGSPACLVLTSDPFWYARQAREGRFAPHFAPNVLHVDRSLVDLDGRWVAARRSLMVMAVNADVPEDARPRAFADLADPRYAGKITMPDPLASGTAFTWLAFAVRDRGWAYVDALESNGIVAAGGNSAVLGRVTTGERPIGVLLLENLLTADAPGVVTVLPTDGAVVVPGPLAITSTCPNPRAAEALYDLLLSAEGQAKIVAGDMFAAVPELPPPEGAPPLDTLALAPWTAGFADEVVDTQVALKDRWAK